MTLLNHIAKLYKNWPIVCFSFMRGLLRKSQALLLRALLSVSF